MGSRLRVGSSSRGRPWMAPCSSLLAAAGGGSHIPWMAAAQPAWPAGAHGWPPAAGGAPAAPPGLRSMTGPVGGVYALSPALISNKNSFQALDDDTPAKLVIDSSGTPIIRDRDFELQSFVKPTKPSKKRRGRRQLSSSGTLTSATLQNVSSDHCQIEKSSSDNRSDRVSYTDGSAATCSLGSCCSTCKPANVICEEVTTTPRRPIPTACTYDTYQTIEPHSGMFQTYPFHVIDTSS